MTSKVSFTKTPLSRHELMQKANAIAGLTLEELSEQYEQTVPTNLLYAKGWVGTLLENILGTNAGNQALPDFKDLNIELKTLPIKANNKPKETTYITVVPLTSIGQEKWEDSIVCKKLQCVLWIPVEADVDIPLTKRRIGNPLLWTLDPITEAVLKKDWEEFAELICLGKVNQITANLGTYLHIRPKAANAQVKTKGVGEEGHIETLPRGFYLRTSFTEKLLKDHYLI